MIFKDTFPKRPFLETLYTRDEKDLLEDMLEELEPINSARSIIASRASSWIERVREMPLSTFNIQRFLQAFPLTQEEGRSLMALAEAFLRIPDAYTAGLLLKDKLSGHDWSRKEKKEEALISFSRWGLNFVSFLQSHSWGSVVQPLNLKVFNIFMGHLAREFIVGQTIEKAYERSLKSPQDRFSFDMLGEGARTYTAAKDYWNAYRHAINVLQGQKKEKQSGFECNSISVKLSALHPHYHFSHQEDIMRDLLPQLIELCALAKEGTIALTIDAEEAARLELSMDLIEGLCHTEELKGWNGLGLAVQAYQKRAPGVIEWAESLAKQTQRILNIRLVKGAYWDTEIKIAQVGGYPDYPVFTRKAATDLYYLSCAQQLLNAEGALYPQFATHNAHTVAAILHMAQGRTDLEFQRLQGMGEELYKAVRETHSIACRVYGPVGKDQELLPYLVRRLLENGANSSFVHKIYEKSLPIADVLDDPFTFFETHAPGPHPKIPLPQDIYGKDRLNSQGYDLSDTQTVLGLKEEIERSFTEVTIYEVTPKELEKAFEVATIHWKSWDLTPVKARADILQKAADLLEERRGLFLRLLIEEGKKTLPDAIAEFREAVDYCRYYAQQTIVHFGSPLKLKGPTGETNRLQLRGRGVFVCISPWNFPLAIFLGQVTAALAAGNAAIAKPASPTPLIAFYALQVLYEAGIPKEILHFIPAQGSTLGNSLIADPRVKGIAFTGSTSTAQHIQKTLADHGGPIIPFIAETGGLNAMIVDSSALIEQVVDDVIASAFQSAGQRCSCLRILFIQEDVYPQTLQMLKEAMEILQVGDPQWLSTDVGPVITAAARDEIEAYVTTHSPLARAPLPSGLTGTFVAPTLIEIKGMDDVKKEVFGPVLHVASFKAQDFEKIIQSINQSGYGLTMGLQTRLESRIQYVRDEAHVGNSYVNRNMIGAVVGVQPFGGEGLSGTGPKAGGPHYLPRFAVERTFSNNITASGGNVDLLNLKED
jgi:RHH-type proline utilization regulon transcriptional repressor/proline dehydrogenase/delta 1-pyrroline-5-carboxylate dehydrogenase